MQPCLEVSLHLHTTHPHFRTNFFVLCVSLSGPGSLMSASISKFKKERKIPKKQQQQTLQQTPNSDATFLPTETLRQAAASSFLFCGTSTLASLHMDPGLRGVPSRKSSTLKVSVSYSSKVERPFDGYRGVRRRQNVALLSFLRPPSLLLRLLLV